MAFTWWDRQTESQQSSHLERVISELHEVRQLARTLQEAFARVAAENIELKSKLAMIETPGLVEAIDATCKPRRTWKSP